MTLFLWLQFLLILMILKNIPSLPVREFTDKEWHALLELMETSNKIPSHDNEYYESFTFRPLIVKMDYGDDIKITKSIPKLTNDDKKVLLEAPQETNFWTDVKTFFTKDVNNFAKEVADNYNPIPTIANAMDDVKRSSTWNDVSSFFSDNYDKLVNLSDNVIDDLKEVFNEK